MRVILPARKNQEANQEGGSEMKNKRNQHRSDVNEDNLSPAEEALRNEERSLDIGESGQFAPGGYYNQRGVNEPRRIDLDDDIVPPQRRAS